MKTYIECVPCNIEQCINTLNVSGVSQDVKKKTVSRLLKKLENIDYNLPPAYNSDMAYQTCREVTGIKDPYRELKKDNNQVALGIYPRLKDLVKKAPDPLYMGAKVAVAGNIIDLGISVVKDSRVDFYKILEEIENVPLAADDFPLFCRELEQAHDILYIGDNAGEIVFDRVFLEELVKLDKNITFSVKSGPIINDSTMEDARQTGITDLVRVIETGSNRSGVNFDHISDEFLTAFKNSDLIISKGQANFECLDEVDKNIFFILKAKCNLVAERLGVNYLDVVLVKKKDQWEKKKV